MTALVQFLRIARLIAGNAIVDPSSGNPTTAFLRQQNDQAANLESAVNSIKQQADDIAYSLQQAGIAVKSAQDAQATANAVLKDAVLVNSYVSPAGVLSAMISNTDATEATITIADHNRIYADAAKTTVAVKGSTITGLALSTTYWITYMDPSHAGGMVSYAATSDYTQAGQGNDRHLVGSIVTPDAGATTASSGDPTTPAGVSTSGKRNNDASTQLQ